MIKASYLVHAFSVEGTNCLIDQCMDDGSGDGGLAVFRKNEPRSAGESLEEASKCVSKGFNFSGCFSL